MWPVDNLGSANDKRSPHAGRSDVAEGAAPVSWEDLRAPLCNGATVESILLDGLQKERWEHFVFLKQCTVQRVGVGGL